MMLNVYKGGLIVLRQICKPSFRYYSEKIVPLNETTLLGRIVLFMNNEYNKSVSSPESKELKSHSKQEIINVIDNIKLNKVNPITNLKLEQIEELLRTLNYKDYISNIQHFQKLINIIDFECCSRLDYLDSTSILRILSIFTQTIPNRITEYKFYSKALQHLMLYIDYLSKEELLQTVFYIGLQKNTKNAKTMLHNCLRKFSKNDVSTLSIEELCIICNSTFKTSTKITIKGILEKVRETLNNKLYLLKDASLFVTLIKTIRHNRYQDDNLLSTISCTILFNKTYEYYNFPALCHILAMYADYKFYDEEILNLFVYLAIKQLKESSISNRQFFVSKKIRPKDITRFLWVVSYLGHKIDKELFNIVTQKILEGIEAGMYKKDTEELINSCLYLWTSNYQALDIISYAVTQENMNIIRNVKSQTNSRLNLLLTCIFFENKELFKKLNLKAQKSQIFNTQMQLEQRPNLIKILTILKQLSGNINVNKFEVTYEIPHLNICGITGYAKNRYKTIFIEILDDYVCVKNQCNVLIGPMQLKLRILKERDEALLTIPSDIMEKLNQKELEEYLKSEIDLLC